MIRRVDKYLAQQHRREPDWIPGLTPILPVFPDKAVMLDDYHSVREPSELEYDSEETDPQEPEDDPNEDDTSMGSDSMYKSSGHDMDQTRRTNTVNRNQRHNQRK